MPALRRRALRALLLPVLALALAGCESTRFSIATPADFVEREESDWSSYAYRALNADAVVIGVREVDEAPDLGLFEERKEVSLAFWLEAVKNKLQASHAYALLGVDDLGVASGQSAKLLRLAREDGGVQHDYWVGLVDDGRYLYVLEAGGRREAFQKVEGQVRASLKSFRIE